MALLQAQLGMFGFEYQCGHAECVTLEGPSLCLSTVCVCVCERESVCVCERERECVCVCERESNHIGHILHMHCRCLRERRIERHVLDTQL